MIFQENCSVRSLMHTFFTKLMFSLESMSVNFRFFDKQKFYFDSLVTGTTAILSKCMKYNRQ